MSGPNAILILGGGRSGRAAQALAGRLGFSPVVLDEDAPLPSGSFAFAVISPGVPQLHPWRIGCDERGISVISELQFGAQECMRLGIKMLAVTGSKGKSSVVKAVADGLSAAGFRAVACGNYGKPVSEVAYESAVDWAVVEVSSFQMETTSLPADAFAAATVLNLQEDHLDRHGTVEVYHALKRRLLKMASTAVAARAEDFPPEAGGSYFDNAVLRQNGGAAFRLMLAAGLDSSAAAAALRDFKPLPHRMNEIGFFGGVRYIDDSKATSLAALAAGIEMSCGAVRLIAGGLAKGDDPSKVIPLLTKRVKKVYLIGCCAEVFFSAWSKVVECEICGTLQRAVESASRDVVSGETVLLSPGAASFDQFSSFGERGNVFAELVNKVRMEK